MGGYLTPGVPAISGALTGNETFYADTNASGGVYPQSAAFNGKAMSRLGRGGRATLTDASTIALDASTGSSFIVTLGATGRTLTISNASPGQVIDVQVVQDGTGSRTITTYTNVLWAGGTLPTLTTTAAAIDVLRFTYDATRAKFFAETVGKAYA